MTIETRNAIIKSARLTKEDHGCLTVWLDLDYGGSGQGFGGHNLYNPKRTPEELARGGAYCGHFIWRVLEIAGVERWDDLPGKTVRVTGGHGHIEAIGHIIKDDWFCPREDFAT